MISPTPGRNTSTCPFFFFNATATTDIYTLSLHDALPIYPFTAFGSSTSAGCRLRYYARRAGIVFPAGRSHGLHSLRGALAVAMLQADTPPPVVAAVLGHAAANTTAAHYLRLDTEHLRRCALDVEDVLNSGQGARS